MGVRGCTFVLALAAAAQPPACSSSTISGAATGSEGAAMGSEAAAEARITRQLLMPRKLGAAMQEHEAAAHAVKRDGRAAPPPPPLVNAPQAAFDTGTPPSAFGINGFDVSSAQSVA